MSRIDSESRCSSARRVDQPPGALAAPSASRPARRRWRRPALVAGSVLLVLLAGGLTRNLWFPRFAALVRSMENDSRHDASESGAGSGADSAHDHGSDAPAATDSSSSLELSEQGRKNIGLVLATVSPRDFSRTIAIPGILVERPGRTEITVSASMTGIVTRIYPIRGEAVAPGDPLFDLRLTHEDLVDKQSALLKALEELDAVKREVARLEQVTSSGAVAGKTLLERQYEQRKIEAALRAAKQALVLHGLTQQQIEKIEAERQLIPAMQVSAPPFADDSAEHDHDDFYQVGHLAVKQGDHVTTGMALATLSDHCELHIEGKAFEHDAQSLNAAANAGAKVTALVEGDGHGKRQVAGLRLLYVENQVDRESRALKFYVALPNELVRNEKTADGHRFIGWRYKPGQRVEVLVPVEEWKNRVVLPVEAVVQEGPESYVYQQKGSRFDRKAVHVQYRDQQWAVLGSDGVLFPGDVVAAKGAYQIHLALKNKSGRVDPHAGHNH